MSEQNRNAEKVSGGFGHDYISWLKEIKEKIAGAQIRAALSANREIILFYWDMGGSINKKLKENAWGNKVIDQLSKDLSSEFPGIQGFSRTNLYYIKKFHEYFRELSKELAIVPQTGGQIEKMIVHPSEAQTVPPIVPLIAGQLPWSHIKIILDKIKNHKEALFYIKQALENNWSRDTLSLQIKSDLYNRSGKAINNFKNTLPEPMSDLAQQTLKDPYMFDFMTMTKPYIERDIENQLIDNISRFLLELGKGFAFVGRQYHLQVGESDYYIDLLFYHIKLKCYVVVELKNTKFIPEYAGKLNFYLSAVDSYIKEQDDNPTIGILLCKDKNNIEAEFALRDIRKPMGVSEFEIFEKLPDNLKSSLPTVEEIEQSVLVKAK